MKNITTIICSLLFLNSCGLIDSLDILSPGKEYGIPEKARVIHIPQIHYSEFGFDQQPQSSQMQTKEYVVRTQLKTAKIMIAHPNDIHVDEGLTGVLSDIERDFISYSDKRDRIDKNVVEKNMTHDFYKKSYEDLTDIEREFIYEHGSSILLFFLGHIDSLYPSAKSREEFNKVMDQIDINDLLSLDTYDLATSARESQLKEQVDILLEAYPNKKIFIGYGAGHYLSDVF